MKRHFLLTLILTAAALGAIGTGTAAAQNQTNTTATPTPEPTGEQVSIQVSETLRVEKWRFENGSMHITLKSKVPTRVVVTDSGQIAKAMMEGGENRAVQVRQKGYNIGRGETTITVPVTIVEEMAAITVSDVKGGMVFIRAGKLDVGKPAIEWSTVNALLGFTALVSVGGTYRYVRRKQEDEQKEAERFL